MSSSTASSRSRHLRFGRALWQRGDMGTIDRFGPDGIALTTRIIARGASLLQSGYLYHYAFAMLIGVVAFLTWYIVASAG